MYQALYRKYRPAVFDDVCGQEHITSVLKYETSHGRTSHAYLFCGSRGTGKTTCAKILAKAINCERPVNGNPCGECESCHAIDAGYATDVLEMDAASNNGVEYIRDIRDEVAYTPAMMKKRVYIIDEVHMLSQSAFNALLKTLEEPPAHAVFVLATTELHKLPATIVSRCQRFDFRRLTVHTIAERLRHIASCESIQITADAAELLAKLAQGGMRDAISLFELVSGAWRGEVTSETVTEMLGLSGYETVCRVAVAVAEKKYAVIFEEIHKIASSSKDIAVFWQDLCAFYRDMLVVKAAPSPKTYLELTEPEYAALVPVADRFTLETLLYHSRLLDETMFAMQKSQQTKRLCAEMTLIRMCDERLATSNEALTARIAALEDTVALLGAGGLAVAEVEKQAEAPVQVPASMPDQSARVPLDCWNDAVERLNELDKGLQSFLTGSSAYAHAGGAQVTVQVTNPFAVSILRQEKSLTSILTALRLSGCPLHGAEAVSIVQAEAAEQRGDLIDEIIDGAE